MPKLFTNTAAARSALLQGARVSITATERGEEEAAAEEEEEDRTEGRETASIRLKEDQGRKKERRETG